MPAVFLFHAIFQFIFHASGFLLYVLMICSPSKGEQMCTDYCYGLTDPRLSPR